MYTVAKIDQTSWHPDGSAVILADCGHKHRSIRTAKECQRKLIGYNRKTRTWSAYWDHSEIRHYDHSPLSHEEKEELILCE